MANSPVLHYIRRLLASPPAVPWTDHQLLEHFVRENDQLAFEALVKRHGPLVQRVCMRVLHDHQAAEDAFQATFLVLARKAASIAKRELLANWLYGVAYRTALRARSRARRWLNTGQAEPVGASSAFSEASIRELCKILDEEINSLPSRFRGPFLLCYLEGRTRDQAAKQIGCSLRTLERRLEQVRAILRARLTRRGATLSAALVAALLPEQAALAALPGLLASSTANAAALFAAGKAVPGKTIPAEVVTLAEGVLQGMALGKVKLLAVAVLFLSIGTIGTGLLAYAQPHENSKPNAAQEDTGKRPPQAAASTKPNDGKQSHNDLQGDPLPPEALVRLGTIRLRHGDSVRNVGLFPNGRTLISADWHAVHVWDATTGRRLRSFGDPRGQQFQSVAFSQDGQTVALAMSEGEIDIWNAAKGERLRTFRVGRFPSLQFSPDAKVLAVLEHNAEGKQSLRLLDATTGEELHRLTGHQEAIYPVLFSPDGKTLISCGDDKTVRFWDVATGKQVRQFDFAEPGNIAVSPDGKTLASVPIKKSTYTTGTGTATIGKSAEYVALWDVNKGKETHRLKGHEGFSVSLLLVLSG
jgi:RNA polymerase sigma factor (sigma-70 family)